MPRLWYIFICTVTLHIYATWVGKASLVWFNHMCIYFLDRCMMKVTAGIYFWKQCKDWRRAFTMVAVAHCRYFFCFIFFSERDNRSTHLNNRCLCLTWIWKRFATRTAPRYSTPAAACSPCCCLATHSQVSAAVPPDHSAASFPPAVTPNLILHMNVLVGFDFRTI